MLVLERQLLGGAAEAPTEAQLDVRDGEHEGDDRQLEPERVRWWTSPTCRAAFEGPQAVGASTVTAGGSRRTERRKAAGVGARERAGGRRGSAQLGVLGAALARHHQQATRRTPR